MTELLTHREYANGAAESLQVDASGSVDISITVYQSTTQDFAYDNSETVNVTTSGITDHPLSAFDSVKDSIYWLKVEMNGGQLASTRIDTDSSTIVLLGRGNELRGAQDAAGHVQRGEGVQQGYERIDLTDGLVAYYPFDSPEVDPALDEALGNHGTINGAAYTSGKVGQALSFDGSGNNVDTGYEFNLGTNPFTVSAWIYFDNITSSQYPTVVSTYSGDNGIIIGEESNGYLRFWLNGSEVTKSVTVGSWIHVVCIRRPDGTIELFENSTSYGTSNESNSINNNNNLYIGCRPNDSQHFGGDIDEVRIYDRALSTPEVQALYELTEPQKIYPEDTL